MFFFLFFFHAMSNFLIMPLLTQLSNTPFIFFKIFLLLFSLKACRSFLRQLVVVQSVLVFVSVFPFSNQSGYFLYFALLLYVYFVFCLTRYCCGQFVKLEFLLFLLIAQFWIYPPYNKICLSNNQIVQVYVQSNRDNTCCS